MKMLISFFVFLFSGELSAQLISPFTAPSSASLRKSQDTPVESTVPVDSAFTRKVPLASMDFSHVPQWESYQQLEEAFFLARDQRLFLDPEKENFFRRITWLYPLDGCFTRAGLSARLFDELQYPDVGMVYIFGPLFYRPANARWVYHVAPIVRVGEALYVLDQAINPAGPLLFSDWVSRFSTANLKLTGAICKEAAWTPNDHCDNVDFTTRDAWENLSLDEWNAKYWMPRERSYLGERAQDWLDNNPPWLSNVP